jgi:glucokinase
VKLVHDAALAGDEFARRTLERVGWHLGVATGSIINIFNPDMIVFGGAMTGAGDFIMGPLRESARSHAFDRPAGRARITVAALGNDAGIVGTAGLAVGIA